MICRLFELNEADIQTYRLLIKQPYRARSLAAAIGKDRSTVYRSLQRLVSCGLCRRLCSTIQGGGRFFTYEAASPDIFKEQALHCIEDWYNKMKEALTHFVDEFHK
jgi:predicted transcriptional regulator